MSSENILPQVTPELNVSNLKRSLDFYVRLLGFRVKFERPEEGFAAIEREGATFLLDEIKEFEMSTDEEFISKRKWNTGKIEYPFGRGLNFLINTEDLLEIYERLRNDDYPIKLPMEEKWYRVGKQMVGVRQFMVMDPDGFLLRFDQGIGVKPAAEV